ISKHLGNSYAAGYADKDGTTIIDRCVSQFELGDFVPLALTASALALAGAGGEDLAPAHEASPEEKVQEDLAQISAGMTVYKISEGKYPASIDDLVRPLANYPDGCLGNPTAPVDPWGHAYQFKLNEKGKPFLWSTGPDGVDQQGTGDDLVKAKK
ncbi:MAG TPA: type II secretion system protein GspG, partial [Planctomycetota bacterium]|nr:type II secretion system protein GspG [Planctomycetota bacterium]